MSQTLTPEAIFKLRQAMPAMPDKQRRRTLELLKRYDANMTQGMGKESFLDFINHVYPGYKVGPHHLKLIQIFEDIAAGKKKRVIVNIAPRHGKSELISYLAPAWFLGKYPQKKIIMGSHTADLAVNFGRRVRNLVGSEAYKGIFPQVELQSDSKSASRWGTNFNGEYFAIGVGGALAGRGADLFIIDDPHSEQEAKTGRPDVFLPAWEWFQSGPLQRLMPGGAIIIVMTRWSKLDLTGMIVQQTERNEDVDPWEVVEFPAIKDDGQALWPEFWDVEELLAKKAALDIRYWNAQYMQKPTSEEGALIKREWWQIWEKEDPPECEFIIMSLDAAQEATNRADYNALTTWGVFYNEETQNFAIILLNAIKKRMEYPELKKLVLEEYKEWQPDAFMVEKKSNGSALYQEFRRMGVPVGEFTPGKGQDKIARVNAVSDLFASGIVFAPDHRWAKEVIEECNDFPAGTNDDLVDSTTLALLRFRQGGFLRLPTDEPEDNFLKQYRKKAALRTTKDTSWRQIWTKLCTRLLKDWISWGQWKSQLRSRLKTLSQ
jgi:predicted phage terminase large subunit-like protein